LIDFYIERPLGSGSPLTATPLKWFPPSAQLAFPGFFPAFFPFSVTSFQAYISRPLATAGGVTLRLNTFSLQNQGAWVTCFFTPSLSYYTQGDRL